MSKSIHELVAESKAKRIERTRRIPVIQLVGEETKLLPPGSGMLIIAERSSDIFDQLHQALATNDIDTINNISKEIKTTIGRLKNVEIESAFEDFQASKAVADLFYGPKQVVFNAFTVAGVGFTHVLFSFAGGDFKPSDFRLVEYVTSEKDDQLQALVVVHEPAITARERAVLRNLPEESRGMVFGPADPMAATPAALVATVTAGVLVAVVGTALTAARANFERIERVERIVFPEEPSLAVKQLLEARREALGRDR
ncbi:hypothetical protein [Priestia endophytica]|uniref:hypothetical protein n=1 Tax=Priestia endophytica TaxID=135735 RepID=UPI00124D27D1|nr:hypothetical protein [Priestia endophytica]KAB2489626.1 hypothetical protein F8155_23100 [Priestia endophytica]